MAVRNLGGGHGLLPSVQSARRRTADGVDRESVTVQCRRGGETGSTAAKNPADCPLESGHGVGQRFMDEGICRSI